MRMNRRALLAAGAVGAVGYGLGALGTRESVAYVPCSPADVKARTLFGACPASGDDGSAAVTKWGSPLPVVRRFLSSAPFPTTLTKNPNAYVDHISFSMSATAAASFPTNTTHQNACLAMLRSVPADQRWKFRLEIIHERNNKVNGGGGYTIPIVTDACNKFYDLAAAQGYLVVATYTAWLFDPNNAGENPDDYGPGKCHIVGLDMDGIHATSATNGQVNYPDYSDEKVRLQPWMTKWGVNRWSIPEIGTSRDGWKKQADGTYAKLGVDTNGTQRDAWIKKTISTVTPSSYAGVAPEWVCWYDYESTPGNVLTAGSPEFTTWSGYIAGSR